MNDAQNWRVETDAGDYFGHQKKRMAVEQRRPIIRKAADLVGPGIGAAATKITDFNDTLATFDGYFGAAAGAANAPTSGQAYVGIVTSDSDLGGMQVFYGMSDGGTYKRVFNRSGADATAVSWGTWKAEPSNTDDAAWKVIGATGQPAFQNSWVNFGGNFSVAGFRLRGGVVRLKGMVKNGTVGDPVAIFTLPAGYRPAERRLFSTIANTAVARLDVLPTGEVCAIAGSNVWFALDGVTFEAEQ